MKKAIGILLKIAKILDVIVVVSAAVMLVAGIMAIPAVIGSINNMIAMGDAPTDEVIVEFVVSLTMCSVFITLGIVFGAGSVANLIVVSKTNKVFPVATSKSQLRGYAIANIITGAISSEVALVAGILMLVIKDRQL